MLIDVNSQQSGALFKSLMQTGTSGKSWWETSSYELLKEKLLMWKLMTSIFVEESQKCLRGAPLWAYRIRRVVFLFRGKFLFSYLWCSRLLPGQASLLLLEGTISTQIFISPLFDSRGTTLRFSPSAVPRQTSDHLHRSHVYVHVLLRNPGI